jgi:hypothetical protein
MNGFSVTYEIVTFESAENGDTADDGFICENVNLRDAIAAMNGACVEPSCHPFDPAYPYTWFTQTYPDINYHTGEHEYRALHMPQQLTASTRRRIARLLGVK